MNQAAVSVLRRRRPDSLFLTTFCPGEPPEKSCYDLLFSDYDPDYKVPGKSRQYLIRTDNKKSTRHRFSIDISWIFSGASSDTAFFEKHRSTICFRGHRIATCLYRTPMGGCIEKTVAFYIPHNLKIIKYAQRSLLPSPGANERCFFCLQRKEASVKWQYFG